MSELAWMHLMNKKCSRTAERWHIIQSGPLCRHEGINNIHQAPDTKLINHSAVFYHPRETTPDKWPPFDSVVHVSSLIKKKKSHHLSHHFSSSSVCSAREHPLVLLHSFLCPSLCGQFIYELLTEEFIFHLSVNSGTEAHVSSEGAEEEKRVKKYQKVSKEPRAVMSRVRIMRQQRGVFLLYLWRTRPGRESFRVTLSSHNETPRLHVTHFLLKLEETKLMRDRRGGERERERGGLFWRREVLKMSFKSYEVFFCLQLQREVVHEGYFCFTYCRI